MDNHSANPWQGSIRTAHWSPGGPFEQNELFLADVHPETGDLHAILLDLPPREAGKTPQRLKLFHALTRTWARTKFEGPEKLLQKAHAQLQSTDTSLVASALALTISASTQRATILTTAGIGSWVLSNTLPEPETAQKPHILGGPQLTTTRRNFPLNPGEELLLANQGALHLLHQADHNNPQADPCITFEALCTQSTQEAALICIKVPANTQA